MTRMIRSAFLILMTAGLAAAVACSNAGTGDAPQTSGQPATSAAGGAAATASKPPVAVTTAPVAFGTFRNSVEVVGTLAPKFSAEVKSEVTATVTDVFVTEWVPVRKGDRLARFDTSEIEAGIAALRAGEAQARVGESRAKREYERAQQLKQFGLITP